MNEHIKRILLTIFAIGILLGVIQMGFITFPYFSMRYDIGFLLTKQAILHKDIWRYAFYSHISSSLLVLFFGLIQFSRKMLIEYKTIHRTFGKVYILLVLFCSAPSGLVMALYANGGFWPKLSFTVTSILWWWFTFKAFTEVKRGNYTAHLHYMVRSYAMTLSAISLRLYVLILPMFIQLHAKDMYTLVAWLSWIPNLIIAEFLLSKHFFKVPVERG